MSMSEYSLSDLASVTRDADGFGGGNMGFFWIFALLLLAGGGFGGFGNNNRYADSALNTFATASSQNEILLGQKFDALSRQINQTADGICSSTYALNNAINGVSGQVSECCCNTQRAIDSVNYNGAINTASINANTTAQTQKILDAMAQNKIESLQSEVNNLKTQQMFCGVPKINPYLYGVYPYTTNGCGSF